MKFFLRFNNFGPPNYRSIRQRTGKRDVRFRVFPQLEPPFMFGPLAHYPVFPGLCPLYVCINFHQQANSINLQHGCICNHTRHNGPTLRPGPHHKLQRYLCRNSFRLWLCAKQSVFVPVSVRRKNNRCRNMGIGYKSIPGSLSIPNIVSP